MSSATVTEDEKKAIQRMQLKQLMTECLDDYCETIVGKTLAALDKGKEVKTEDVAKLVRDLNAEFTAKQAKMDQELQETKNTATSGLSTLKGLIEEEKTRNATRDKKLELQFQSTKDELAKGIHEVRATAEKGTAAAEKSIVEQEKFHRSFKEAVSEEMIDNCPNCGFEKSKPFEKDGGKCTACNSIYSNIDKTRGFKKCAACGYPIKWNEEKEKSK